MKARKDARKALASDVSRANVPPSTPLKKDPGTSTEDARAKLAAALKIFEPRTSIKTKTKQSTARDVEPWELNGEVTEQYLAATEKEGMVDQELLDLVWEFGAKL